MTRPFDLQGHRGARGLKPENTLAAFEVAFDLGVTSVETDLHLSRDGVPVVTHDPEISERLCRLRAGKSAPDPSTRPRVSTLSLSQLRQYRADRNPDPRRFPGQDPAVTPLAARFAEGRGIDALGLPTLADLFEFAAAYTGEVGRGSGKSDAQRARVGRLHFDLELKRVPFRPELIGDAFDANAAGTLEDRVLQCIHAAGVVARTTVRSFDHRSVRIIHELEPQLTTAILVAGTAVIDPGALAHAAGAQMYCPDFEYLDEQEVRLAHAADVRVVPWTVNEPADWQRLLDWGVDGITTDYPDRLAAFLTERRIVF